MASITDTKIQVFLSTETLRTQSFTEQKKVIIDI